MSNWLNPKQPYTGTGDKPTSSLPAEVKITFRDKDGKRIPRTKKK